MTRRLKKSDFKPALSEDRRAELQSSHVIVEFDRANQTIVEAHLFDFPSDADAAQFAADMNNEGTNCSWYTYNRWFREGTKK